MCKTGTAVSYWSVFNLHILQEEFYVYADDTEHPEWMRIMRSVKRIVAANEFIFVITNLGICVAFRLTASGSILPCSTFYQLLYLYINISYNFSSLQELLWLLAEKDGRIRYFNGRNELVEVLFYNEINDSVIIVSSMLTSAWADYYIRALPLE